MSNPENFSRLRRNFLTKKNTTKNQRLRNPPPPKKSGLLEGGLSYKGGAFLAGIPLILFEVGAESVFLNKIGFGGNLPANKDDEYRTHWFDGRYSVFSAPVPKEFSF